MYYEVGLIIIFCKNCFCILFYPQNLHGFSFAWQ